MPRKAQKTAVSEKDWHYEDIKAAVRKTGATLSSLAQREGYATTSFYKALRRPWPAIERVIAGALNEKPQNIWPSRYDSRGRPLNRRRNKRNDRVTESHRQIGGVA